MPWVQGFITDMREMATHSCKEQGKVGALQARKKLHQGEQQQRTSNFNYILNIPPFHRCGKTV